MRFIVKKGKRTLSGIKYPVILWAEVMITVNILYPENIEKLVAEPCTRKSFDKNLFSGSPVVEWISELPKRGN
jgi:hypothetical protein